MTTRDVLDKVVRSPAVVTADDLELLGPDSEIKAWAVDRRYHARQTAAMATAMGAGREAQFAHAIVETIAASLAAPVARIAELEAQVRTLTTQLLDLTAQVAARDPVR